MIRKIFLLSFILMLVLIAFANAGTPIPYTQDDRDRAIRIEEGLKAVNQRIDEGLKAVNQRIDGLQNLIYVVLAGIFGLVGFVLWDRRTFISPIAIKIKELEAQVDTIRKSAIEREFKTEKLYRELDMSNPEFAKAFKTAGLV